MLFVFWRDAMRRSVFAAFLVLASLGAAEAKPRTMFEGGFWGGRWVEETDFWSGRDVKRTVYHREHRFFTNARSCEAWLYRMRSTWQDMPRYSWCKRVRVAETRREEAY
jgi:hypothetical protein